MAFLVMCHYWHQYQMMLMALSIAPLHSFCPDNQSEVLHDFSCHGIPLALMSASHDVVSILKVTITFLRSKESN